MILGAHVIMGFYGFWLPNDPRGSWSEFVAAWELFRYGGPTKVTTRRSLARRDHDRAARLAAKRALNHRPVHLTGVQARAVGRGFVEHLRRSRLTIWACAILPDHAHLVLARPTYSFEQAANLLKGAASRQLSAEGIHPLASAGAAARSIWARRQWTVFLNDATDLSRAIRYVRDNPVREGLRPQRWACVTPYEPEGQ